MIQDHDRSPNPTGQHPREGTFHDARTQLRFDVPLVIGLKVGKNQDSRNDGSVGKLKFLVK